MRNLSKAAAVLAAASISIAGLGTAHPAAASQSIEAAGSSATSTSPTDFSVVRMAIQPNSTENLPAPTNIRVTAMPGGVRVSWDRVLGAASYAVYVGQKDVQGPLKPAKTTGNGSTHTIIYWNKFPTGDAYRVHVASQSLPYGEAAGPMSQARNFDYTGTKFTKDELRWMEEQSSCWKAGLAGAAGGAIVGGFLGAATGPGAVVTAIGGALITGGTVIVACMVQVPPAKKPKR
jgi:hypothetical protein